MFCSSFFAFRFSILDDCLNVRSEPYEYAIHVNKNPDDLRISIDSSEFVSWVIVVPGLFKQDIK